MRELVDHKHQKAAREQRVGQAGPVSARMRADVPMGNSIRGKTVRGVLIAGLLAGVPLISGCVGSTVSTTLETAALNSPTDLTLAEANYESDFSTLSALPVPIRSPQSHKLSLASTQTSPALEAVNLIAQDDQPSNNDNSPLQTAMAESAGKVSDLQTLPDTETGSAEPTAITGSVTPVQTLKPSVTQPVTQPVAKKPGGLLAALFGNRQKTNQPPKNIVPTENSVVRSQADAGSLPGVKRSSALFGIESDTAGSLQASQDDGVQVASVGSFGRFQTVNGLILQTAKVQVECFKPELMRILQVVERRYGKKVMVTSGYRSPNRNRRAGGVRNSSHIYCKAADIQVEGVSKWDLAKFLRTVDGRGGVGTYCRTDSVHVDTGSVRDWHHPCRRNTSRVKKKKA